MLADLVGPVPWPALPLLVLYVVGVLLPRALVDWLEVMR